jgi:hypothetical protein
MLPVSFVCSVRNRIFYAPKDSSFFCLSIKCLKLLIVDITSSFSFTLVSVRVQYDHLFMYKLAQYKNPVIYHRGDQPRAQSLRTFQSTFGFSDASAFSAHSAVKLEDIVISLENSTVPYKLTKTLLHGHNPQFIINNLKIFP